MSRYWSAPDLGHEGESAVGVLVSNLGTPEAATAGALRPYLREFLSDPRVIELPRLTWWLILNLFVLTRRPRYSAGLYRKVWTAEGSPLLTLSKRQVAGLAAKLAGRTAVPLRFALGMRYGRPSLRSALRELAGAGCRRILVLPLYPQYAAATTGSTFDAVTKELSSWRWVPELRTVNGYHDEPGYVAALAASIRELWARDGEPERLLLSFHGMPVRYFESGDPYPCFCQKTARLVREQLGFPEAKTLVTYQSRFGREEWLKPYTDLTLKALPAQGVKRVDIACPGFSADCLETLEEIDGLNREFFLHAGGERYRYIPCLNDRDDHLEALAALVVRQLGGWDEAPVAGAELAARAERAGALAARLAGQGSGRAPG